ncbi:MAG: rhodanese-like domain-containing protein [Blastochloris sp.]|nr:rhodanese-like domain-containing protein [Blastochloris sp.]
MTSPQLSPEITMQALQEQLPGARRTLFRHFHIGGCSSCGFRPEETLAEVCHRNENLNPEQVIEILRAGYEEERKLLVSPTELKGWMDAGRALTLVDVRSKEEFEAVRLPGALRFDQELMSQWKSEQDKQGLLVFYDHRGQQVLDAASYFVGHGFPQVRCLEGGQDAWALQIDPAMPRYVVE